jgi:uncharacterized membrane protein YbaN (DUF454 family)
METKSRLKRIAIYAVGWAFIILGVLGIVLPILQGVIFLLIGLYILSSVSPRAARMLIRLRKRFPRVSDQFERARARAKAVLARIAERFNGAKAKARDAHAQVFKRKPRPSED